MTKEWKEYGQYIRSIGIPVLDEYGNQRISYDGRLLYKVKKDIYLTIQEYASKQEYTSQKEVTK